MANARSRDHLQPTKITGFFGQLGQPHASPAPTATNTMAGKENDIEIDKSLYTDGESSV